MRLAPLAPALALAALVPLARAEPPPQQSPQVRAVLEAQEGYKRALLARDTAALARIWAEDYTFVNASGALVTRAQRLANFASGATSVSVIDNEREVTVRVHGDAAVVHTLATLRAVYDGRPSDTDLRATLVWVRRGGRWQMVLNHITPAAP